MNDPTCYRAGYYAALADEQEAYADALAAIYAEQDEGRLTAAQVAAERADLIGQHHGRLEQLREQYLGGAS